MEVTRYSSSVFLQPHQLISGWLQRAITAPFFWCLPSKVTQCQWFFFPLFLFHRLI